MKGLERIRVSVVVGGSSWVCREVDHSERTMEPSDGIRLPVTVKKKTQQSKIDGPKTTKHTIHNRGIILVENCGSKKRNKSNQNYKDRKINAEQ